MFEKMFRKKKEERQNPCEFICDSKKVEKMSREEYLKYYIKVLTKQINEASKILKQKKAELKLLVSQKSRK